MNWRVEGKSGLQTGTPRHTPPYNPTGATTAKLLGTVLLGLLWLLQPQRLEQLQCELVVVRWWEFGPTKKQCRLESGCVGGTSCWRWSWVPEKGKPTGNDDLEGKGMLGQGDVWESGLGQVCLLVQSEEGINWQEGNTRVALSSEFRTRGSQGQITLYFLWRMSGGMIAVSGFGKSRFSFSFLVRFLDSGHAPVADYPFRQPVIEP